MKHKVGDTVKIKSIDWFNAQEKVSDGDKHIYSENNIVYFTKDMSNYCSKEAKIEDIRIDDNIYFLDVDKRCYEWTDEMLDENYDFKQLAVGETFDFKGHKLRVEKVQKTSSCENCFFEKLRLSNVYACDEVFKGIIIPSCCIYQRNDNNRVIFKEVTDMEQRTIKLDIETARKWYNGSDDSLKTLALQVFSEDELKTHVKVWEDLFNAPKNYKGFCIKSNSNLEGRVILGDSDKCVFVDEKHAKSALAMAQISQLMPYYGGRITDEEWGNSNFKQVIKRVGNDIVGIDTQCNYHFLAFHTIEQQNEFLKNNEQLVKEYLMID